MQSRFAASRIAGFGWTSLLMWIAGTMVGWAFGFQPAMFSITGAFYSGTDHNPNFGSTVIAGACILLVVIAMSGAITGASQQVALSGGIESQDNDRWFVRTLTGTTIGWVLGWIGNIWTFSNNRSDRVETWLLSGLVIGTGVGLSTGIAQWRIFRGEVPRAGWWVMVCAVSWAAASIVYWLVYHLSGGPFEGVPVYYEDSYWVKSFDAPGAWPAMINGWLAGGLLLGSVTGIAIKLLVWDAARLTGE